MIFQGGPDALSPPLDPHLDRKVHVRNEFNFWNVHGIMNTLGLVQSKQSPKGFTLFLQETRSIHDSMNILKIEFITYIYILYYQSSVNFKFSSNLAGFPDISN